MTMPFARRLMLLAAVASPVSSAVADEWTGPKEVAKAAGACAEPLKALHKSIRAVAEDSPLVKEVDQLANSTQKFRAAVEKGMTYEHALVDFRKLGKSYDHFREALKKDHDVHHDTQVEADAKRLKAAFDRLQSQMQGRREPEPTRPAP